MAVHRHAIGDRVEIRRTRYQGDVGAGVYTIVRLLPNDGMDREYRIKSTRDGRERVVLESALIASAGHVGGAAVP